MAGLCVFLPIQLLPYSQSLHFLKGFPGGEVVKNPPVNAGDARDMGREDPLEEEIAAHSSILAWRIPWTKELCGLQSTGSRRVCHH